MREEVCMDIKRRQREKREERGGEEDMTLPPLSNGGETAVASRRGEEELGRSMKEALSKSDGGQQHWTAALLGSGEMRQESGYAGGQRRGEAGGGGRARTSSSSSSTSRPVTRGRQMKEEGEGRTPSLGRRTKRSMSLENRSAEAYYKHLDRFKVERTDSWLELQRHLSSRPQARPVILKPLKIIRPASKAVRPKWIYGNPWARTEKAKEIRDGRLMAEPLFGTTPNGIGGQKSEPDSAGSLEVTVLKEEDDVPRRWPKEKAGEKRLLRRQQSKSAWSLIGESETEEEGDAARPRRFETPPRKARIKPITGRKGLVPNGNQGKISPFLPLPSMSSRKKLIQSRGNRVCHSSENSEDEEDVQENGDDENPRRSRRSSVALPATKKTGVREAIAVEVMTIHHEKAPAGTTITETEEEEDPAVLSDEEEIKFEEAREIIEGVFTEYLDRVEKEERGGETAGKEEDPEMSETQAASTIEGVFLHYLAEKEEREKYSKGGKGSRRKPVRVTRPRAVTRDRRGGASRQGESKRAEAPRSGTKRRRDAQQRNAAKSLQASPTRKAPKPRKKPQEEKTKEEEAGSKKAEARRRTFVAKVPNSRLYRPKVAAEEDQKKEREEEEEEEEAEKEREKQERAKKAQESRRRQNEARRRRLQTQRAARERRGVEAKDKHESLPTSEVVPQRSSKDQNDRLKHVTRRRRRDKEKAAAKTAAAAAGEAEEEGADHLNEEDNGKDDKAMTMEEAAGVIEDAFIEFLEQEDEEGETSETKPDKVPKKVFTDYSDKMAENILDSAKKELKSKEKGDKEEGKESLKTIQEGDEAEGPDSKAFDQAVEELVGNILGRECRNQTNDQTTVPDADFNSRPKFNFVDLCGSKAGGDEDGPGDPGDPVEFSARPGSVPPRPPPRRTRRPATHQDRLRRLKEGRTAVARA